MTWGAQRTTSESADHPIRHLAIAQYEGDVGFFLFSCDEDWNVIWDSFHDSIADALTQARYNYDPVHFERLDELS